MTFSSNRQPDPEDRRPRGPSRSTLMIEAIREETGGDEKEFFKKVIRIGLGNESTGADPVPMLLSEAMKRIQPPLKPNGEKIKLDMAQDATAADKCNTVFLAVTDGAISPEQGQMLIGMIKDTQDIAERTELVKRLEEIEKLINTK